MGTLLRGMEWHYSMQRAGTSRRILGLNRPALSVHAEPQRQQREPVACRALRRVGDFTFSRFTHRSVRLACTSSCFEVGQRVADAFRHLPSTPFVLLFPLLNTDLLPSDVTPLSFTVQTVHCVQSTAAGAIRWVNFVVSALHYPLCTLATYPPPRRPRLSVAYFLRIDTNASIALPSSFHCLPCSPLLTMTMALIFTAFPFPIDTHLLPSFSSVMLPTFLLTCLSSGSSSPLSPHRTLYHAEVLTASAFARRHPILHGHLRRRMGPTSTAYTTTTTAARYP
jgi:hypothetical protein